MLMLGGEVSGPPVVSLTRKNRSTGDRIFPMESRSLSEGRVTVRKAAAPGKRGWVARRATAEDSGAKLLTGTMIEKTAPVPCATATNAPGLSRPGRPRACEAGVMVTRAPDSR